MMSFYHRLDKVGLYIPPAVRYQQQRPDGASYVCTAVSLLRLPVHWHYSPLEVIAAIEPSLSSIFRTKGTLYPGSLMDGYHVTLESIGPLE